MIISLLLFFLFLIVISGVLFFIFCLLLPAMRQQSISTDAPIFSKEEVQYAMRFPATKTIHNKSLRAVIKCSSDRDSKDERFVYYGPQSCRHFAYQYETSCDCDYSCIGLGDCARACPQNAIDIKNNTAVVTNLCTGCGKCVDACPKKLIALVPVDTKECVLCNAPEGASVHCSTCHANTKLEIPVKTGFKHWETIYKFLYRK
ncbi:MAG: 4Fe-4S binding protein [Treponema sp.]|nr:4Fe-4S binding protein [Treponema sp.]